MEYDGDGDDDSDDDEDEYGDDGGFVADNEVEKSRLNIHRDRNPLHLHG